MYDLLKNCLETVDVVAYVQNYILVRNFHFLKSTGLRPEQNFVVHLFVIVFESLLIGHDLYNLADDSTVFLVVAAECLNEVAFGLFLTYSISN